MTPINTIYVSGVNGSPTGNGSIAEPINTIADGIALAAAGALADGIAYCVYVYSGTYDEQILVPTTADPICITLGCGAEVIFSSPAAPTVDERMATRTSPCSRVQCLPTQAVVQSCTLT